MQGKVALITGAGSGIGRATAAILAARGCRVVCGDLNVAAAEASAAGARAAGGEALVVSLDVTARDSAQAFVAAAEQAYGRVDFLVNSAGIWELSTLLDLEESHWDRMLAVNLKGMFLCCQAAVAAMLKQGAGAIVNVASVAGRNGGNYAGAHYSASKGGVVAMSMQMARELAPRGIRVNCVAPGPTDSPMTANWPAEVKAGIIGRTPVGRLARAEDIAEVVVFLLSEQARHVVGETVEVNGGLFTH
ncbi:MAG: SDR family NAD(P)-dependent oxidoreductase [Chloroflexota bacterium]